MTPVLVATRNPHKLEEFRQILADNFEVHGLEILPCSEEVDETGDTFEANARLKAVAASKLHPGLVLGEDSGLAVDALAGEPGVLSARFAGEPRDQNRNNALLLERLQNVRGKLRSARFHCVIAAALRGRVLAVFHGAIEGTIVRKPKGRHGFGYDPLFVPVGFCQTFAQLGPEIKNAVSHRNRAIQAARSWIQKYSASLGLSRLPRNPGHS